MKKNFKHVLLGTFIDESLKCANLTMTHICKETGMGKASYENIKKGRICWRRYANGHCGISGIERSARRRVETRIPVCDNEYTKNNV